MMRTREILILGIFIIAVCALSFIPFSNISADGFQEGAEDATTGNTNASAVTGNTNASAVSVTTAPKETVSINMPITINNNIEFINTIIYIISRPPDNHNDKISIYNIQSKIAAFGTKNSATLLSEMSNPSNLTDSRLFLQYMNWFASHCPLDSDVCTGLC